MLDDSQKISGGVTAPVGFLASAVKCGVKIGAAPRLDLALIVSEHPTEVAATFTTNKIKAAPVRVSAAHLRGGDVRAIIANSGNANACTGVQGIEDARAMAGAVADELGLRRRQVVVCSTGIIGVPLPFDKILPQVPKAVKKLSRSGSGDAAKAIMTSDTSKKEVAYEFKMPGTKAKFKIGGIAKGAGMIRPNMATMLAFLTTDAKVEAKTLKRLTLNAVDKSFNRITVDGDTSTNDTVFVMANGAAGGKEICLGNPEAGVFEEALIYVMEVLAKKLVKDGERVTKMVEVEVKGAATVTDARKVAEAVANSNLVKCSWNGEDPNWGRVIHAVGYSGARVREELVDIYFGGLIAAKGGLARDTALKALQKVVKKKTFTITIDLNLGAADYSVFASDLSPEYVDFNRAEYALAKLGA